MNGLDVWFELFYLVQIHLSRRGVATEGGFHHLVDVSVDRFGQLYPIGWDGTFAKFEDQCPGLVVVDVTGVLSDDGCSVMYGRLGRFLFLPIGEGVEARNTVGFHFVCSKNKKKRTLNAYCLTFYI